MTRARSVPPTPLVTKTRAWIIGVYRAIGSDPDVGEQVASILGNAGLSVEGAAAAGLAGTAGSVIPEYWVATLRSILPMVLAHGQATEAEVDIDTVAERITRELEEAGAILWLPEMAATWARVP